MRMNHRPSSELKESILRGISELIECSKGDTEHCNNYVTRAEIHSILSSMLPVEGEPVPLVGLRGAEVECDVASHRLGEPCPKCDKPKADEAKCSDYDMGYQKGRDDMYFSMQPKTAEVAPSTITLPRENIIQNEIIRIAGFSMRKFNMDFAAVSCQHKWEDYAGTYKCSVCDFYVGTNSVLIDAIKTALGKGEGKC